MKDKVNIGFSLVNFGTGFGLMVRTAMVGAMEGPREAIRNNVASKQDQLINRLKEHKVENVEFVFLS